MKVERRAGYNYFKATEYYFKAFEYYFKGTEYYFKGFEIILSVAFLLAKLKITITNPLPLP